MTNRRQFDIVVVGAGPAGLAAACAAAESGRRVAVIDDTPWLGGQIWRGEQSRPSQPQARAWFQRFQNSGATLLDRTSVIAAPERGVLLAEQPGGVLHLQWEHLILATGSRELFLPFQGWTLPGIFGPGGLQALVKNGWPIAGKKVVIAGSGPLLFAVADGLVKHGARVLLIAEQSPLSRIVPFAFGLAAFPAKLWQGAQIKMRTLTVPYKTNTWPLRADGEESVRSVTLTNGRRTWTVDCDAFACGFGLVPNVELPLAVGCALKDGFVQVNEWQATSVPEVFCAGEPAGIGGADCALVEGTIAGYAASGRRDRAEQHFAERARWHRFRSAMARGFALRPELKTLASNDTWVCRCEDVTLGRMQQFNGWRDAKLHTRCGMGPCQGRLCGAAAKFVLDWTLESVRPPVLPARVESLITPEAITAVESIASNPHPDKIASH